MMIASKAYRSGFGTVTPPPIAALAHRARGIGDADTERLAVAATTMGLSTTGAFASGSIGAALAGTMGTWVIPVVGPVIAGLTLAVPFIAKLFEGCGQTCVQATHIADQAEVYLKANKNAYLNGTRTVSSQLVALDTFDKIWAQVFNACSNPALAEAGQRCISERIRGGSAPWCPTGSGCDWFILYRDPIANDPGVVPDPTPPSTIDQVGGVVQSGAQSVSTLLSQTFGVSFDPTWVMVGLGGLLLFAALPD